MILNTIYNTDCRSGLRELPDSSVNCIVTSPPYFGLRDYGHNSQIGLEETPEKFVCELVDLFRECKRVLRNDGTFWLNIGDSYAGYWGDKKAKEENRPSLADKNGFSMNSRPSFHNAFSGTGIKPKDLIGIPWMLAFALRADGWYLRQDIIWHKPNPMPESVTDRCTKSHEYIFLLSKSERYYYDYESIKQPMAESSFDRLSQNVDQQEGSGRVPGKTNGKMKAVGMYVGGKRHNKEDEKMRTRGEYEWQNADGKANKRSVWSVTTKPFKDAHFATYPQELIVDCIKAGCPIGGVVLDPFMGAGTTAVVARKLNRNYVGFELNQEYVEIANKRIYGELGMFA